MPSQILNLLTAQTRGIPEFKESIVQASENRYIHAVPKQPARHISDFDPNSVKSRLPREA
jgi:hypothetical protein